MTEVTGGETVAFGGEVAGQDPALTAALKRIAELEKEKADRAELESNISQASSQKRLRIFIEEKRSSSEIDPVFVGCNGRGYYIKRGHEVDVPVEVVHILDNAIEGVVKPRPSTVGGVDFIKSLRFPFRKLGLAVDENGTRLLPELDYTAEVRPS
jgi:hypothetical protein